MAAALVALVLLSAACASSKDSSRGFKSLEATVVDREHEAPGTRGASFAGTGNYYLVFEARDGDATVRYRFQVTLSQYNRYVEGSRVQLLIADNLLRDIRPLN